MPNSGATDGGDTATGMRGQLLLSLVHPLPQAAGMLASPGDWLCPSYCTCASVCFFSDTRLSKRKSIDTASSGDVASLAAEAVAKRGRRPTSGAKSPGVGTAVPYVVESAVNGHPHLPPRLSHLPVHRGSDSESREAIIRSEIPKSVVKVFCTHCEPNYSQPWTTRRQTSSTSTGFVTVDAGGSHCILTNAHSVDNAAVVQVRACSCP
ncbi:uncharacterized protein LOC34623639 [Cyclospora cayetanensis]|uniref:Uncharacterized protein LOC34623639 n=1 Tax=Cyclospora cayetanensis TaxID=88456 RepID=A0A6P6S001_9EIME|nr:uncharacterized protein LOC34623639 [Cyclospora cayetanensis]